MMDGIKQMKQSDNAVTEIIGTMLLIAISLGLFSVVYVSVLTVPYVPPTPTANIACLVVGNEIILEHYGGDSMGLDTKLLLSVDGVASEITLGDIDGTLSWDNNGDEQWSMGERIVYSPGGLSGKQVTINIIDELSNSIVTVGTISPQYPILTYIESIAYEKTSSPITLSATSTGVDVDNITLWYKWGGQWGDSFTEGAKFAPDSTNMSFDEGDYVIVQQGGIINSVENYVDTSSSDIDGSDYGSHSSFSNMQDINDPNDVLTEEDTGSGATTTTLLEDDFESGLGNWNTDWDIDIIYSNSMARCDSNDNDLISDDLDTSDASSIEISFDYYVREIDDNDNVYLQYYDGSGYDYQYEIGNAPEGTWHTYSDKLDNTGADSQYFISNFRLKIEGSSIDSGEYLWVDNVQIDIITTDYNYQLDLEVKWTTADYNKVYEKLCIYAGPVDSEDIQVDFWNGSWENVFSDLSSGWNNASVDITSANFIIRFKGGSESSDANQDSWEIDAVLLHTYNTADGVYQGNITSIEITKPSNCNWSEFYADVNNTVNSTFSILDESGTVLVSNLQVNGEDISDNVTVDKIKLFGSFDGPVRLDSWNVTFDGEDWQAYETDTYPYSWEFPIDKTDEEGFILYFWFYSIGKADGYSDESPPSSPDYDTRCKYIIP